MGGAYGKELKRILLAHGCRFVRNGKGDHANAILKQAGIDERL